MVFILQSQDTIFSKISTLAQVTSFKVKVGVRSGSFISLIRSKFLCGEFAEMSFQFDVNSAVKELISLGFVLCVIEILNTCYTFSLIVTLLCNAGNQ